MLLLVIVGEKFYSKILCVFGLQIWKSSLSSGFTFPKSALTFSSDPLSTFQHSSPSFYDFLNLFCMLQFIRVSYLNTCHKLQICKVSFPVPLSLPSRLPGYGLTFSSSPLILFVSQSISISNLFLHQMPHFTIQFQPQPQLQVTLLLILIGLRPTLLTFQPRKSRKKELQIQTEKNPQIQRKKVQLLSIQVNQNIQ